MTKKEALTIAINTIEDNEAKGILYTMIEQLSKPRKQTEEAKAKANAKRKEATAQARATLVATVTPILTKYLSVDITANDLFEKAKNELPEGFTVAKVRNVLMRELAPSLVKTEAKGKANVYRLKEGA